MKAVHFGAGNIGRGFVGLLLHEAGYEVVFVDVAADLIDSLASADRYVVHEVGAGAEDHEVTFFRALNSASAPEAVIEELAAAEIVTTAVGPNILKFVAPLIADALLRRDVASPIAVMACENAINATDLLRKAIEDSLAEKAAPADVATALGCAVFANTAVDRIVPGQAPDAGLDVTVESYYEWAIDRTPFGGAEPSIPGVTWVDDLAPYIERKLFTVNTGHATIAYYGFVAGARGIADALGRPEVESAVRAVLGETKQLLVDKHGIDAGEQQAYIDKILTRFANPHLPDTVDRVGRQPLRKLSRHERFIAPAAELAERGTTPLALVDAVATALRFDVQEDEQSVALREKLAALTPEEFVQEVCGIAPGHPLFDALVEVIPTPAG
jgi:mannitol-1-phosphate 5-dehydrogenase